MDGPQPVDGFQFDYDLTLDKDIQAIAAVQLCVFVNKWDRFLPLKIQFTDC